MAVYTAHPDLGTWKVLAPDGTLLGAGLTQAQADAMVAGLTPAEQVFSFSLRTGNMSGVPRHYTTVPLGSIYRLDEAETTTGVG